MLGAVLGDIIGSSYEWHNVKTKDFPLVTTGTKYTDDTVMTLAVAKWLMEDAAHSEVGLVRCMQELGRAHIMAGYGSRFIRKLAFSLIGDFFNGFCNTGCIVRFMAYGAVVEYIRAIGAYNADWFSGKKRNINCGIYKNVQRTGIEYFRSCKKRSRGAFSGGADDGIYFYFGCFSNDCCNRSGGKFSDSYWFVSVLRYGCGDFNRHNLYSAFVCFV
mgnify:CR=1 FL=1